MKAMKRIFAGALALTMAAAVTACGNSKGNSSSDAGGKDLTDDQKKQVEDIGASLEDVDLANKTIKWMAHYDINPSKGQVKSPALELFESKYGGKVEYVQTTWDKSASACIASGRSQLVCRLDERGRCGFCHHSSRRL